MTKIEWVKGEDGAQGRTWNPLAGCSIATTGCRSCYAMRMAARLEAMGQELYAGLTEKTKAGAVWTGVMREASEDVLFAPLRRRKPTTYFVNSMSDLFHEGVPTAWIDKIWAVMSLTPHHTYQILTKRSARMRAYFERPETYESVLRFADSRIRREFPRLGSIGIDNPANALNNVWLGVSTERQQEADIRIPDLLATPAKVRFISAEPLLGPIDLVSSLYTGEAGITMRGYLRDKSEPDDFRFHARKLDWVIAGGESGAGARLIHPDWVRTLRDQCAATGTAFFFKQWGEFAPARITRNEFSRPRPQHVGERVIGPKGEFTNYPADGDGMVHVMRRFGKKKSGHLLDGLEHREMPLEA